LKKEGEEVSDEPEAGMLLEAAAASDALMLLGAERQKQTRTEKESQTLIETRRALIHTAMLLHRICCSYWATTAVWT